MACDLIRHMHDAELIGIDSSFAPSKLILRFRQVNGTACIFILGNCSMFRVVDYGRQNVVSQLFICTGIDCDDEMISHQLKWLTSLSDSASSLSEAKLEEVRSEIKQSKHSLMVLIPSCGAEFAAVYEGLDMQQV